MGKVYIAKGGELYKFGNSEDPEMRLRKLQTGSPVPLELVYTFDAKTPRRAETELKRMFAAKHSHGEWFKLTEADILDVKQATTSLPASPSPAPQQPSGARTGVLKALHDLWQYRSYLLLFCVLAVPTIIWLQSAQDLPEGYIETGTQPTLYAVQSAAPAPSPIVPSPTDAPASAPLAVAPISSGAPPVAEPTPAELVPINDATAAALGGIVEPAALAPPTQGSIVWVYPTTAVPTLKPIEVVAATVQADFAARGIEPLDVPIITPRGYWGP